MSLATRVIPCLDVDTGRVVKGVNFENLRDAGDPVELARRYAEQGADDAEEILAWLRGVLATPAPEGTILAMHHPPMPSVLDLAASVELRDQRPLAEVLEGSDVRSILAGHLHYSSTATFAGIPVSVASATCYTQDLTVPVGGTRGRDGARAFNLVHVYPSTIVHSVVPLGSYAPLDVIDAEESARRLEAAGVRIEPSRRQARMLVPA